MTTIPEKYTKIILNAIRMGDTGSIPLEQSIQENIERAIEEAGVWTDEDMRECWSIAFEEQYNIENNPHTEQHTTFDQWLNEYKQSKRKSNTANASYPTQPE